MYHVTRIKSEGKEYDAIREKYRGFLINQRIRVIL